MFTLVITFASSVIGAISKQEWFHRGFAVFFFAHLLVFIGINLQLLS